MNEKFCILIRISLKFVPKGPIDNKSALVQVMTCHLFDAKPLPEPMIYAGLGGAELNMTNSVPIKYHHRNFFYLLKISIKTTSDKELNCMMLRCWMYITEALKHMRLNPHFTAFTAFIITITCHNREAPWLVIQRLTDWPLGEMSGVI